MRGSGADSQRFFPKFPGEKAMNRAARFDLKALRSKIYLPTNRAEM